VDHRVRAACARERVAVLSVAHPKITP
jgi:hypothetical protein